MIVERRESSKRIERYILIGGCVAFETTDIRLFGSCVKLRRTTVRTCSAAALVPPRRCHRRFLRQCSLCGVLRREYGHCSQCTMWIIQSSIQRTLPPGSTTYIGPLSDLMFVWRDPCDMQAIRHHLHQIHGDHGCGARFHCSHSLSVVNITTKFKFRPCLRSYEIRHSSALRQRIGG